MGNKKVKGLQTKVNVLFAVLGLIVVGLLFSQAFDISGTGTTPAPGVPPVQEVNPTQFTQDGETLCTAGVSRVVTTFNSFDLKNKGTASAERHNVWYVGSDGSLEFYAAVNDAGTLDIAPGKKYRVMFGNYSESTTVGFYPTVADFVAPCDKGQAIAKSYQKDKNATAVTSSFYNSDDNLINSGIDPNAISANGEATMVMKLATSADDYFGDGSVLIVFNVNNTAFTDLKLTGGSSKVADPPRQHTGVVGARSYAFELPELAGANLNDAVYSLTLKAGTTEPSVSSNVTCNIYDKSWFINARTNLPEQGYQDEDSNDIGSTNAGQGNTAGCIIQIS